MHYNQNYQQQLCTTIRIIRGSCALQSELSAEAVHYNKNYQWQLCTTIRIISGSCALQSELSGAAVHYNQNFQQQLCTTIKSISGSCALQSELSAEAVHYDKNYQWQLCTTIRILRGSCALLVCSVHSNHNQTKVQQSIISDLSTYRTVHMCVWMTTSFYDKIQKYFFILQNLLKKWLLLIFIANF